TDMNLPRLLYACFRTGREHTLNLLCRPWGPSQRMDVWFCEGRNDRGEAKCELSGSASEEYALSRAISPPFWIIAWIETIFMEFRGPKALAARGGSSFVTAPRTG